MIPLGRLGSPRDVANAVLFLASDDADPISPAPPSSWMAGRPCPRAPTSASTRASAMTKDRTATGSRCAGHRRGARHRPGGRARFGAGRRAGHDLRHRCGRASGTPPPICSERRPAGPSRCAADVADRGQPRPRRRGRDRPPGAASTCWSATPPSPTTRRSTSLSAGAAGTSVMNVNLDSVLYGAQAAMPHLKRQPVRQHHQCRLDPGPARAAELHGLCDRQGRGRQPDALHGGRFRAARNPGQWQSRRVTSTPAWR